MKEDGLTVGVVVAFAEGTSVGFIVGTALVGLRVGLELFVDSVGCIDGIIVGLCDGQYVGEMDGSYDGTAVGPSVIAEGETVGFRVGMLDGTIEGIFVDILVGTKDGASVG